MMAIRDVFLSLNLNILDGEGKCYDETKARMGGKFGFSTKFKCLNSRMLIVYYYEYASNLPVSDFIKNVHTLKKTLSTTKEICNLVKRSNGI